ncbi:hypothetical protein QFZ79_002724 [Arthrobacter sp. V4I6]|nr:hypothetical protein [Arthrobacter sp. V1I7]MDQ0854613.1 hypothetical protein [Arthrobacter sp. V4I6]
MSTRQVNERGAGARPSPSAARMAALARMIYMQSEQMNSS